MTKVIFRFGGRVKETTTTENGKKTKKVDILPGEYDFGLASLSGVSIKMDKGCIFVNGNSISSNNDKNHYCVPAGVGIKIKSEEPAVYICTCLS